MERRQEMSFSKACSINILSFIITKINMIIDKTNILWNSVNSWNSIYMDSEISSFIKIVLLFGSVPVNGNNSNIVLKIFVRLTPENYFQKYFSYIVAASFIGGENRRRTLICRKSLTNIITCCCIEGTSPWAGFKLTTLAVIGTEYIGNCIL